MSSTFSVRRSVSGNWRFAGPNVPPLAITAIPRAHPAFSSEKRRAPAFGLTIVVPKRMASLSLMLLPIPSSAPESRSLKMLALKGATSPCARCEALLREKSGNYGHEIFHLPAK
jgi:hypothetical protein